MRKLSNHMIIPLICLFCIKWLTNSSGLEICEWQGIFQTSFRISVKKTLDFQEYRNDPKFSDRQAWANSVDPDQMRAYTVCHSVCILITTIFCVSEYLGNLWLITNSCTYLPTAQIKGLFLSAFILRLLVRLQSHTMSQLIRLWYLPHRRPAKGQASLRIPTVSPEPSLFAHMKIGCRQMVRPKIRPSHTRWLRMRI